MYHKITLPINRLKVHGTICLSFLDLRTFDQRTFSDRQSISNPGLALGFLFASSIKKIDLSLVKCYYVVSLDVLLMNPTQQRQRAQTGL